MYDVQIEKAVLGCMILDVQCFNKGISNLTRKDFYEQKNKVVFDRMLELFDKNIPCDLISCTNKYISIEYVTDISNIIPSTQGFNNYYKQLKALSVRRLYVEQAEEIKKLVHNSQNMTLKELKNDIFAKVDIDIGNKTKDLTSMDSIHKLTFEQLENEEVSKAGYGFSWLDKNTSGVTPKLIYLGARPSIGKTTFAMNIALTIAKKGLNVAVFSLETTKEQIFKKLIAIHGNIKYEDVNNYRYLDVEKKNRIKKVADELRKLNINIYDNVFNVEGIRSECWNLKNNDKLDYVVVDYIQLCETSKKSNGTNERVSHISRQFKLMQMEFKVQFLVLCQLSRESAKENRYPKLTDLRDSGSLEQDANDVWFLHDKSSMEYENEKESVADISLIIAKQREGQRDIFTDLKFYKNTQLFTERCPF